MRPTFAEMVMLMFVMVGLVVVGAVLGACATDPRYCAAKRADGVLWEDAIKECQGE